MIHSSFSFYLAISFLILSIALLNASTSTSPFPVESSRDTIFTLLPMQYDHQQITVLERIYLHYEHFLQNYLLTNPYRNKSQDHCWSKGVVVLKSSLSIDEKMKKMYSSQHQHHYHQFHQ